MKNEPAYYSILTSDVRYDKKLSSSQKVFFSEITALTIAKGYCFASNKYFANLYDVSTSTISSWVSALVKQGYIKVSYIRDGKEIKQRNIFVNSNSKGYTENATTVVRKSNEGYTENLKENNTSINNTSITYRGTVFSYESLFEHFWNKYPVKTNKKYSKRTFLKLKPNIMIKAIDGMDNFTKGKEVKYIKNMQAYLNGEHWNDEIVISKPKPTGFVSKEFNSREFNG